MKKILTAIIVAALIATQGIGAWAENQLFTNYSDDDLRLLIYAATEELNRREELKNENDDSQLHMTDGTILVNENGIVIKVTGAEMHPSNRYFELNAVLENNRDSSIEGYISDVSINGWTVASSCKFEVRAGEKHRFHCTVFSADAQITEINEIEKMVCRIYVYDLDSTKRERIIDMDSIVLVP